MKLRSYIFYVLLFTVCQLSIWAVRHFGWLSSIRNVHLLRIQHVLAIEFVMSWGSLLIWWRVRLFLHSYEKRDNKSHPYARKMISNGHTFMTTKLSKLWTSHSKDAASSVVMLFLILAHLSYAFYFWSIDHNPSTLVICSFVSTAAFVYLNALIIGFMCIEATTFVLSKCFPNLFKWLDKTWPKVYRLFFTSQYHTVYGMILTVWLTAFGLYSASLPPKVVRQKISINSLPTSLDHLTIALLTDIHIGPSVGRSKLAEIVDIVNGLSPDVIAISGDLVDGSVAQLGKIAEPLKYLRSKYGVFFTTGNHEYYHGNVDEWFDYLKTLNILPLHNSNKILPPSAKNTSQSVCLAGVDDLSSIHMLPGHGMDLQKALAGCHSSQKVLLLAHQPNAAYKLLRSELGSRISLILSGHTHGGQLYVLAPFSYFFNRYYLGLYEDDLTGAQIYVSAGTNFYGPPVKMYGFREITLITVVRK